MAKYKTYIYFIILNFCLSLLVVFFSPRFDILTFFGFSLVNIFLLTLLIRNEKKKEEAIEKKIEDIFFLLHLLDVDSLNREVKDDEFSKLRDEIIKIIIENKKIAENAQKNRETLRQYTEDIAHQIKSPLTGALLMVDLLKEDRENYEEYLPILEKSIKKLLNLVDILLKLAALDSNVLKMKKEKVSSRSLLEEILESLQISFAFNKDDINIYGDDFTLICDISWTYEALYNLVKNAFEASDQNPNLYLKETKIYKSIIIEDFSQGLSKDMEKKVFKRFYKKDPNSKGYGIGLPMAKTVIEKQDGELLYVKGKSSNTFEARFYK